LRCASPGAGFRCPLRGLFAVVVAIPGCAALHPGLDSVAPAGASKV